MASHRKYTPPPAPVPEVKIDGTATAPDLALSVDIPDDAAHEYQKEIATADEVTVRLRKQLDDIKKSEEYQRQRQAAAMQPSPDQVLQFWKHNGLGEFAVQFLLTHPQHIVGLTDFASRRSHPARASAWIGRAHGSGEGNLSRQSRAPGGTNSGRRCASAATVSQIVARIATARSTGAEFALFRAAFARGDRRVSRANAVVREIIGRGATDRGGEWHFRGPVRKEQT